MDSYAAHLEEKVSYLQQHNDRLRGVLQQIAGRAPQLDSMEISACFRELREITALAQSAL